MPHEHAWHACQHGFVTMRCRCPGGGDNIIRDQRCPISTTHDEYVRQQQLYIGQQTITMQPTFETAITVTHHIAGNGESYCVAQATTKSGFNAVSGSCEDEASALGQLAWNLLKYIEGRNDG